MVDWFEVKKSFISGDGLFAKWKLPCDFDLGRYCPNTPLQRLEPNDQTFYHYGLEMEQDGQRYLIDGMNQNGDIDPTAKMNHSFDPNVAFLPNGHMIVIRTIEKDEECLVDYGMKYWMILMEYLQTHEERIAMKVPYKQRTMEQHKLVWQAKRMIYHLLSQQNVLSDHYQTNGYKKQEFFCNIEQDISNEINRRKHGGDNVTKLRVKKSFCKLATGGNAPRGLLACKQSRHLIQKYSELNDRVLYSDDEETTHLFKKQKMEPCHPFHLESVLPVQSLNTIVLSYLHMPEMLYLTQQWEQITMEQIMELNKLDLLKWSIETQEGKLPKDATKQAAANGQLQFLKYFQSKSLLLTWNYDCFLLALTNWHFEVLRWAMYNHYYYEAQADLLALALKNRNLHQLKWVISVCFKFPHLIDVPEDTPPEIIKWIEENEVPCKLSIIF